MEREAGTCLDVLNMRLHDDDFKAFLDQVDTNVRLQ